MIIILNTNNNQNQHETVIEVNMSAYDMVCIAKNKDGSFQLALKKYYDAYFTDKSMLWYVLATLDTYEKCLDLYDAIRTARHKGEVEFDLEAYLKELRDKDVLSAKDIPDIPTV